jgi:hypothetical protein
MITELGETQMQIGIDSFAAAYDDASLAASASDRLRNLVEQIEFADQVGLDVWHRRTPPARLPRLSACSHSGSGGRTDAPHPSH